MSSEVKRGNRLIFYTFTSVYTPNLAEDDSKTPIPRQQIEYWKELNKTLHKDYLMFLSAPKKRVTPLLCQKIAAFFSENSRKIIMIEEFPNQYEKFPNFIPLDSYIASGDSAQLYNNIHGIVVCSNFMRTATSTPAFILPPLYTFFDFMRSPHTYDSMASQKSALHRTLTQDGRVVEDLMDVIAIAPAKALLDDELNVSATKSIHTKLFCDDIKGKVESIQIALGGTTSMHESLQIYFSRVVRLLNRLEKDK